MAGALRGEIPDLEPMKKLVRDDLRHILESSHGVKDLFIDPSLMKTIDRLADIRFLKEHGVDKIYKIDTSKAVQGNRQRIYIARPTIPITKLIMEQLKAEKSVGEDRLYTVVYVPRALYICTKLLEVEGVYGWLNIENLSLNLLPIDRDIITMELDFFYTSYFLNHDETWVHTVAAALVSLQQSYGKLQNVYAVGQCAKNIWDLSQTLLEYGEDIAGLQSQIGHVIILDRDVDLISPLCSQVTYEGLLDDTFGIHCGVVEFDQEVTGTDKCVKMPLSSQDKLFDEVRNKHFSTVFKLLSSKAKDLQKKYDTKDDMSVAQMKNFVANELKDLKATHKSLTLHISACEVITKRKTQGGELEEQLATEHGLLESQGMTENIRYIEDSIHQQRDKVTILRLMCLLSLVKDGLSPDTYESLKTSFLQSHGYQHILTFHHLAKLGLFTKRTTTQQNTVNVKLPGASGPSIRLGTGKLNIPKKSSFQVLRKNLNLIPKHTGEIDLRHPTDMAYVFSGTYTPMSCKLVELILQKRGFGGIEESIKLITNTSYQNVRAQSVRGGKSQSGQTRDPKDQTVLVCFVGGVTYSEIAALRFLGHLTGYRFLILTTNIITGNRFISKLMEP